MAGDTLSAIASRYGISVEVLMRLNDLNTTLIRIGQSLMVVQSCDNDSNLQPATRPATRPVVVRLDPTQSPPASVAIYAEIPGEGPHTLGDSYFLVEGSGTESVTVELPAAGYLIYGYSLEFEDISYFAAWTADGGLAFVDGATANEVLLQRPPNPCDANYQLPGSPDGRFAATDNPDFRTRFGCDQAQAQPDSGAEVSTVAGTHELTLTLDGSGDAVYLQLDEGETGGDAVSGDVWFYFQAGVDHLQAVNGAKLLPVAADVALAGCSEPNPQLFHADAIAHGVKLGTAYCVYTSGGQLAHVQITNRIDITKTSQSWVTVVTNR